MTRSKGNGHVAQMNEESLARGLGWFSIGLGLAALLAPRRLGRTVGVGEHSALIRLIALRELVSGLGILTRRNPSGWLQARVAGDIMDIALLGAALTSENSKSTRVALAGAAVAGVAAMDFRAGRAMAENPGANLHAIRVTRTVTIDRPAEELFQFWRNFENLPRIMSHLQAVEVKDDKRSHWVTRGPAGSTVEWDAEIVNEHLNEMIAWRSCEGSDVDNGGSVRFTPASASSSRGTVVKVELKYDPPAGAIGATVARLFGESPEKQIAVDLMRFKQLMETGEIASTDGQSSGRKSRTSKIDRMVQV